MYQRFLFLKNQVIQTGIKWQKTTLKNDFKISNPIQPINQSIDQVMHSFTDQTATAHISQSTDCPYFEILMT